MQHKAEVAGNAPGEQVAMKRMRRHLKMLNPRAYQNSVAAYNRAIQEKKVTSKIFELMIDYSYSSKAHENIVSQMNDNWIEQSGNVYAGLINFKEMIVDDEGADKLWQQAASSGLFGAGAEPSRLDGLSTRKDKSLAQARTMAIYKASRFGLSKEARAIFDSIEEAGVARREDYMATMWSFGSYEEQLAFWEKMELAGRDAGWTVGIEAFNAVLWALHLEDRSEEMHQVLARMKELNMTPNDKTLHAVQRAGERLARTKRKSMDRPSWQTQPIYGAPRLRVGL